MKLLNNAPDSAALRSVGERLAAWRLARNLTQEQLALEAGVGLRTIQRLEAGAAAAHLSAFIRVCSALGLLTNIDALIAAPPPSPIAQLERQGKQRKRATRGSPKRAMRASTKPAARRWAWADDQ